MKIKEIKYVPYELVFASPFKTSHTTFERRKIFFLKVESDTGLVGYGEAAPLPEFGSESYAKAEKKIAELNIEFAGVELDSCFVENRELFETLSNFPALRTGFEQAVFSLLIKADKSFFLKSLLNPVNSYVVVNGVLGIKPLEEFRKDVEKKLDQGFTTLKLKAGDVNFENDYNRVKLIRHLAGRTIDLRIDVNGKWSLQEAEKYFARLTEFDIEYIEQPVADTDELIQLAGKVSIPIAADESLKNFESAKKIIMDGSVKYCVFKPMMFGGVINALKMITLAKENNINLIISSSFESALGKSLLVFLASMIKQDYAHGLDTSYLYNNNIQPDYEVINGNIFFDINEYPPGFDLSGFFK